MPDLPPGCTRGVPTAISGVIYFRHSPHQEIRLEEVACVVRPWPTFCVRWATFFCPSNISETISWSESKVYGQMLLEG